MSTLSDHYLLKATFYSFDYWANPGPDVQQILAWHNYAKLKQCTPIANKSVFDKMCQFFGILSV